jgi:hypothetical protein
MRKDSAQDHVLPQIANATHTSQAQAGSQSGEMRQELSGISADTCAMLSIENFKKGATHTSTFFNPSGHFG